VSEKAATYLRDFTVAELSIVVLLALLVFLFGFV
jgi:hypothetical protein